MSQDIELYKYNWDRLILDLKNLGIKDIQTLEKILLGFGEKCGNRYYLLNNEVWEEYNSYYNIIQVIEEYFDVDGVHDILIKNSTYLDQMCQSSWIGMEK